MAPFSSSAERTASPEQTDTTFFAKRSHESGPLLFRMRAKNPASTRFAGLLLVIAAASLLSVSAWLKPCADGMGTHQQLGLLVGRNPLPPCTAIVLFGYPCPTCGMTTAFAQTVRGRFFAAFLAQPAGFVLALATIAVIPFGASIALTGKVWRVNWMRVKPWRVALVVVVIVIGGWVFKLIVGILNGSLPVYR